MFLNIDRQKRDHVALIDNEGNRVTYGELADLMNSVGIHVEPRSLIFLL